MPTPAPVPTMMATPAVPPAPRRSSILLNRLYIQPCHNPRDKEKDYIHNPHRKTRLQHRTPLIHTNLYCVQIRTAKNPQTQGNRIALLDISAVRIADKAEFINGSDEGAKEAEVDDGDEAAVASGTVVCDEAEDAIGYGEGGGDEKDEYVIRGKYVGVEILTQEVGEHA